jgi:hypothetical protein
VSSSPKRPITAAPDRALADALLDWNALEKLMHRDDGRRGLAGYRPAGVWLDKGQLRAAALDVAGGARSVGIVTGFCAVVGKRVTAETDGPPGALFLAHVLESLSIEVTLITDRYALPLVACGCELLNLTRTVLTEFPFGDGASVDRWVDEFLTHGRGRSFTHLIAIERPGPSHTLPSFSAQSRAALAPVERFLAEVPAHDRDVYHDMRGNVIDGQTAKIHRLFETVQQRKLPITTIGIGDGGNEIGMGSFAWEDLVAAIGGDVAGRIACRIATDFALIAGVSNWGAYALALAIAKLRGEIPASRWLEPAGQRELIETLVNKAGAVDGRTLAAEPTVDGLPMDLYLEPLGDMRGQLAG